MRYARVGRLALDKHLNEIMLSGRVEVPREPQDLAIVPVGIDNVQVAIGAKTEPTQLAQGNRWREAVDIERRPLGCAISGIHVNIIQGMVSLATVKGHVPLARHDPAPS